MARFYGLSPAKIPDWLFPILERAVEPLRAEELLGAAMVALLPWVDRYDRRSTIREWQARARPWPEPQARPRVPESERDPVKAAEWFRSFGVRVIEATNTGRDDTAG